MTFLQYIFFYCLYYVVGRISTLLFNTLYSQNLGVIRSNLSQIQSNIIQSKHEKKMLWTTDSECSLIWNRTVNFRVSSIDGCLEVESK